MKTFTNGFFRFLLVLLLVVPSVSLAAEPAVDLSSRPSCLHCGMDLKTFGHSRLLITYADGSSTGLCSIRCAAVELANAIDKSPLKIEVADYGSKMLVDAEKATWVIGGNKSGVMTKRAKWAFAKREDAEMFVREHGGAIAGFDHVLKEAYVDLYEDTKMIRERRKMKRIQQGGGKPK